VPGRICMSHPWRWGRSVICVIWLCDVSTWHEVEWDALWHIYLGLACMDDVAPKPPMPCVAFPSRKSAKVTICHPLAAICRFDKMHCDKSRLRPQITLVAKASLPSTRKLHSVPTHDWMLQKHEVCRRLVLPRRVHGTSAGPKPHQAKGRANI
jgi:hypothetical protein